MSVVYEIENGKEMYHIVGASSLEDCPIICAYFEKFWQATTKENYDLGMSAEYQINLRGFEIHLRHSSVAGNHLTSENFYIKNNMMDIIEDLSRRLS